MATRRTAQTRVIHIRSKESFNPPLISRATLYACIKMKQSTNHVMMVKPWHFYANPQTAHSNAFQAEHSDAQKSEITRAAIEEWDRVVQTLRRKCIQVTTFDELPKEETPDAVFPNNWISFHPQKLYIYPMQAQNRRLERRKDILDHFTADSIYNLVDFAKEKEDKGAFLEGTGSMVLDRVNKIAYACVSPRTSLEALNEWCKLEGYEPFAFKATDKEGREIYHTNVMMSIGRSFAIVCMECVVDSGEKLREKLQKSGHEVVEITYAQLTKFAGNVLQVSTNAGDPLIVMSSTAYNAFDAAQIKNLSSHGEILQVTIPTIERYGGGGVRCMLAEVF